MPVEVEEIETRPRTFEGVQVNSDNILEVAEWADATAYRTQYNGYGEVLSVVFEMAPEIATVPVGGYLLHVMDEDDLSSFRGVSLSEFQKYYRKGWS